MSTWKELAEAFTIFAKYGEGKYKTDAQHDVIYAGPESKEVSEEDKERLGALGWAVDEEFGHFHFFT